MIDEKNYSLITSRNLRRLIFEKQVEQKDVAKALGVSQSIVSGWVNGTRTPKMKNIDALCRYFNCKRSDIMEPPRNDTRKRDHRRAGGIDPAHDEGSPG